MMKYNHPNEVRSPRGYAKHIKPLYDGGAEGVSIAILENSDGNHNIGIRWNVSENEWEDRRKLSEEKICIGMPQSRGYSVWFIMPGSSWKFIPQMINSEIALNKKPNLITISEEEIQEKVSEIVKERFSNI